MRHQLAVSLFALASNVWAQNCSGTSIPATALTDLGTGTYSTYPGGLYLAGSNTMPAGHAAAGLAAAAAVTPRDAAGTPSPTGKVVLLSVGMSNTTQEFSTWIPISNSDPQRSGSVVVVDGAQGGQDAVIVSNPNANFWSVVAQRLASAGVTAQQVQVVWLKEAIAGVTGGFPGGAIQLRDCLVTIAQILKTKYPNVRICYLSSRIYAGYATGTLNPEPYAYESGFAVRWVLEKQIGGDPALNFDATKGAVLAPWLAWGPYLWANGTTARGDGLTWVCSDYAPDGTHPGASGQQKVASMLDSHFRTDPTSKPWYLGPGGGTKAAFLTYGSGCAGVNGQLDLRSNGQPALGNSTFAFGIQNARPNAAALAYLDLAKASISIDALCTLLVDPARLLVALGRTTSSSGAAIVGLPIPNDGQLAGLPLFAQWLVVEPGAPGLLLIGGGALSKGAEIRIGYP